jgi:hypothetical protein
MQAGDDTFDIGINGSRPGAEGDRGDGRRRIVPIPKLAQTDLLKAASSATPSERR